jgi:outer membrane lipoprotein-sorting protein
MVGTGFERQPWLIERDIQFVQLTDLLYRILETIDGRHTMDQIADQVTASTRWIITGEQVRHVIESKLLPLRVIADSAPTTEQRKGQFARTSPLAVHFKLKTIGPELLNPVARVLQFLFYPAVLIPMLVSAAAAYWWLYRVHGLQESFYAMLNTPGGLLAVIGIVFAAGMFHELGHASALKFGGGYVRGMGLGMYLMYPAFYTDVTDGYRLGRWARVRVDLGGVYFHAIASLALIGLSLWLEAELLLIAVLLINVEMARQFIPFVKLDGYWLLADLTGIPDFFSQMGPFVRSLAPASLSPGCHLPQLRRWVRAVFGIYILAVVPALAYMLYLMIRHLPTFVETTGVAVIGQANALQITLRNGDFLTFTLLAVTLTLLAASVVGAFMILGLTILPPVIAAWKWTHGIPYRVATATAGTAVLAAWISLLWYPDARRIYERLSAPAASRQAVELFERAERLTARLNSLRADIQGAIGPDLFTGTVALKRPNLANVQIHGRGGLGEFQVISDGAKMHTFFPGDNKFVDALAGTDGEYVTAYIADQIEHFFRPDVIRTLRQRGNLVYAGTLSQDGLTYHLVDQSVGDSKRTKLRYRIAPDGLIHGIESSRANGETIKWARLINVQLNTDVEESLFAWRVPEGAGALSMPAGVSLPIAPTK